MSSSADADIGILSANRQGGDDTAPSGGYNEEEPTCRHDVYEALHSTSYRGSCCTADKADGTTTAPALPSAPGLRINGVGDVSLPINDVHAKEIKAKAWRIKDESFHKVYQIEPQKMRIQNPTWAASIEKLVEAVAYKLGVCPSSLSAELDSKFVG